MVETRRQQIDDVASALFRERGYAATSVREIARGVDLQGASLYAHVASKEALLWSIVWRVAQRFGQAAEEALASPGPSAERLAALIRGHVEIVAGEREDAAVFLQDWRFLDEPHRAEISARRQAYEGVLRGLLVAGARDGSLRSLDGPADAAVTGRAILAALNGISAWYHPDGPLDTPAVAEAYLAIFMRGLQPPDLPVTQEAQS